MESSAALTSFPPWPGRVPRTFRGRPGAVARSGFRAATPHEPSGTTRRQADRSPAREARRRLREWACIGELDFLAPGTIKAGQRQDERRRAHGGRAPSIGAASSRPSSWRRSSRRSASERSLESLLHRRSSGEQMRSECMSTGWASARSVIATAILLFSVGTAGARADSAHVHDAAIGDVLTPHHDESQASGAG